MMIYKLDDNIIRIVQKKLPPSFVLNKATNYAFKISQGFFWCLLIMEEPPGIPYFNEILRHIRYIFVVFSGESYICNKWNLYQRLLPCSQLSVYVWLRVKAVLYGYFSIDLCIYKIAYVSYVILDIPSVWLSNYYYLIHKTYQLVRMTWLYWCYLVWMTYKSSIWFSKVVQLQSLYPILTDSSLMTYAMETLYPLNWCCCYSETCQ